MMFWLKHFCMGVIALIIVLLGVNNLPYAGKIDGYLNPVVKPLHKITIKDSDATHVLFRAEGEKLRGECGWLKTEFFLGEYGGGYARVISKHYDNPQVRDEGRHVWEKIKVDMPRDALVQNAYSIVEHDCYGGWLWKTYSLYYLSGEAEIIDETESENNN